MQKKKTRILLGITGGVAAYKSADLARLFIKNDIEVQVVMTESATQFVSPTTLQALTGRRVHTDMWDESIDNGMPHIELSRACDLIVIAPATANFMTKVTSGQADDLLSTLCLARDCPLAIAPAMNRQMWENAATQRNLKQLRSDGVTIIGPDSGDQACGEVGEGRMSEPTFIFDEVVALLQPKLLAGKKVVITAGPTYEPIDAVRGITNSSSGKMGYAVAQAAREAGADVTIVSGKTSLATPTGTKKVPVITAQEMYDAVMNNVSDADVFISVAAVADFRVKNPDANKIKKTKSGLALEFEENPDILGTVAKMNPTPFCVGFAAESQDLENYAKEKRVERGIPLIAANLVQNALGSDENEILLIDESGSHQIPKSSKINQARELIKHIAKLTEK